MFKKKKSGKFKEFLTKHTQKQGIFFLYIGNSKCLLKIN